MKLTPSVNFINVLVQAAFACTDPKSVKRYWLLDWVLMLWGATGVKAVRKYVDEIDPRWRKHFSFDFSVFECFKILLHYYGSITPNFVHQGIICLLTAYGKKVLFNFTNFLSLWNIPKLCIVYQILVLKVDKFVHCSLFAHLSHKALNFGSSTYIKFY